MRPARTQEEVEAALALRMRVFCDEQGVAADAEQDGRDGEALHLVALDDARVVATCRLLTDGAATRLGRMAVDRDRRGHGIGGILLREAENAALAAGTASIRLHAQTYARGVYARAGYCVVGAPFIEEGIEHVTMEKRLA